jgi:hypothetical protein
MRRLFSGNSGGYGGRGRADVTEKGQMDRSNYFWIRRAYHSFAVAIAVKTVRRTIRATPGT